MDMKGGRSSMLTGSINARKVSIGDMFQTRRDFTSDETEGMAALALLSVTRSEVRSPQATNAPGCRVEAITAICSNEILLHIPFRRLRLQYDQAIHEHGGR